mgnify:CR=1 FL=1
MQHHEETPVTLMQEHGIKPTANRILVAQSLAHFWRSAPVGLKELMIASSRTAALESVDKSIISRTLSAFRERHLLHVLADGGDSVRYEVCHCAEEEEDSDRHVHFHCEVCGRTFCFEDLPIPAVQYPEGFAVENVEYMAHGVCPECRGRRYASSPSSVA